MKLERLISIIMLLLDKERISAQALAEKFEVSPRTIYRDVDTINMAGIPVRSIPGVGGGFEIMQPYKVDRRTFSAADLSAILMGLTSLSGILHGDELIGALAKVKRFVPADQANSMQFKANQITIDLLPWLGGRDQQPKLETIQTALKDSRLLSFEYRDKRGNTTARTAEPYQLVLKGNQWYWQGYCHIRHDFRLFKLSRTVGLHLAEQRFTPRPYQPPTLDYSDQMSAAQTTIQLRFHRAALDRVLDFCTEEQLTPDGDEHYRVDFPFFDNDYYFGILFSFGAQCECLSPPSVRAEMKRRSLAFAALYGCDPDRR